MKRLRLAILLLLIPLCCIAFAALTKTTSIVELDPWESVDAGTLDVGAAGNISDSYSTLLVVEIAYADTDAQDGVHVIIETSYDDDDWTFLTEFMTQGEATQDVVTVNGAVTAGDTTVTVSDIGDYQVEGRKFFIANSTPESASESMRHKSNAAAVVTLCQDLMRNHANLAEVYAFVKERVIPIPAAFAYVRVIINNTDANADIYYTTRLLKVTGL